MKKLLLCAALGLALANCPAEDINTNDGHTYKDISDVNVMSDGIVFSYDSGISRIKIPFDRLPDDVKARYHYDPFKEGLFLARENKLVQMKKDMAFSLDSLEAAKQKARAENKMIGFLVVWDEFFTNNPARTMGKGSDDALAQFYTTFHNALVLVFVSHERELDKIPAAAKKGIFGPDAGKWSPKMAVTTADCSQFVCFIPYGADEETGYEREGLFKQKIAEMKQFAGGASKP
jgi:hypothetical protein